jgi:hypothetical protein
MSDLSSGYVRGGANANRDWATKFGSGVHTVGGKTTPDLPVSKPQPDISVTLLESEKGPKMSSAQAIQMGYTGDQWPLQSV